MKQPIQLPKVEPVPVKAKEEPAPVKQQTQPPKEEPVNLKKLPEPEQLPLSPIPAPLAFQTTRASSEEEWETGRDDEEEPPVVIASRITPQVVKQPEPAKQKVAFQEPALSKEDIEQKIQDEEKALREQLAQELEEDDEETSYTAIALYDYQAGNQGIFFLLSQIYFIFCFIAAAEDEITFDPDEIITNIEMVRLKLI